MINKKELIINAFKNFLAKEDWKFSIDNEFDCLVFGLTLHSVFKTLSIIVHATDNEYVVYGISPVGVDINNKIMTSSVVEFICRINYGLKNGCFEMDMEDGEIRYRTYTDCSSGVPTLDVIKNSIFCVAAMFEKYSQGFADIIFGGYSAKKAADKCESFSFEHYIAECCEPRNNVSIPYSEDDSDLMSNEESVSDVDVDYIITELFKSGGGKKKT